MHPSVWRSLIRVLGTLKSILAQARVVHLLRKDTPAARRLAEDLKRDYGPLDWADKEKLLKAFVKEDYAIANSMAELWGLKLPA